MSKGSIDEFYFYLLYQSIYFDLFVVSNVNVLRDFAGRENGCQLTMFPLNMLQHILMTFESSFLESTPGGGDVLMWLLFLKKKKKFQS